VNDRPSRHARVAILGLGWFPDQVGGSNRYVRDLVTGLGADACAVVIGPASDAPPSVRAVSTHDASLLQRILTYTRAVRRVARTADVVDAHFALYAVLSVAVGAVRRRDLVVHFQGPWADETRQERGGQGVSATIGARVRRAIEQWVYRRAQQIIVLSDAYADLVCDYAKVPRERVVVIPPGIDTDRFHPGDRASARRVLGIPEEDFVVLAARRLVPRTGVDVLLRAWDGLESHSTRMPAGARRHLLIAGDGKCRQQLEAAAARSPGHVRLLGPVSDDDLVRLYQAADVSVVPSRALEGFGLVVLESLACGTPVIVTDVGGLPEAVRGLAPDLVVPADDPSALAARLGDAINGIRPLPDRCACRSFAERFALTRMIEEHRFVYDTVSRVHRRPRVMVLDHTARLSGGEIALLRLASALQHAPADRGADVTVVCFEDGPLVEKLRAIGVEVEILPLSQSVREIDRARVTPGHLPAGTVVAALRHAVRLARVLRRHQPDVVHANSLKAGIIGGCAARLARLPMVWHVRDRIAADYLPRTTARALRWLIPRLATAVITNSRATLDTLGPRVRSRAVVIPDPYRAPSTPSPRSGADGMLRVAMVGRIAPWKGQMQFIEAFARAFSTGGATAVIAGAPLFGEWAYDRALRERARALGLADRVEFAGFVDDIPALLAQIDVLVHASTLPEPFGQVVVEGMAAGCTVIAANAGGPAEVITPEVDGLLVPPDDVAALASALARVADDPDLRLRLGAAARGRAADFDPDIVVPRIVEVYRASSRKRHR